jgi:hypothetical protein
MGQRPFSVTFVFPTIIDAKEFVYRSTLVFDVPCYRDGPRVTVIMHHDQHELVVEIAEKHHGEAVVT